MPLIEELPPRGEEAEAPTGGASRRPPGEGSSVAASSFSFGKSLAGAAGEGGGCVLRLNHTMRSALPASASAQGARASGRSLIEILFD